jgi:hypothetical protein
VRMRAPAKKKNSRDIPVKNWSRKMRDKVNVSIDHRLKELFEDMMEVHHKTWVEIIEEKVREVLIEAGSIEALEYFIKMEDEKQEERRQMLIRSKANIQVLSPITKCNEDLEKKREGLFEKDSNWLPKQIINGDANWNRIFYFYEFENKKDALAWFRPRIERKRELEKKK